MNLNPKIFQKKLLNAEVTKVEENIFIFFVSLLCMTVYIASDVFLPSLPEMTSYFNTTPAIAQITISIFLIGLASSQIFHGLMADKFGKKTILVMVLPIFLLATIGCILSSNIHFLIACRLIQALSASACLVIGRSVFNDLFEPKRAQRAFAVLVPLVSLSPALAPAVGGFLAAHFQWQASFIFVLFFGFIVSAFVVFYLPESKPPEMRIKSISLKSVFDLLTEMLTNISFLRMSLSLSISTFAWWIYVAGAPLMFHRAQLTSEQIGLIYFPAVVPYIICAFVGRHMLKTVQADRIVNIGMCVLFFGSFVFPFFIFFDFLNIWTIMLGVVLITAGNGFVVSLSMARGISLFQKRSGLAAGLLGTIQLLSGAFASFVVGIFAENLDFRIFCWIEFIAVVIGFFVYLFISRIEKNGAYIS
jgi:DHA1 family bicyclomycin/chloramphenicol resistance-like MFS transporter